MVVHPLAPGVPPRVAAVQRLEPPDDQLLKRRRRGGVIGRARLLGGHVQQSLPAPSRLRRANLELVPRKLCRGSRHLEHALPFVASRAPGARHISWQRRRGHRARLHRGHHLRRVRHRPDVGGVPQPLQLGRRVLDGEISETVSDAVLAHRAEHLASQTRALVWGQHHDLRQPGARRGRVDEELVHRREGHERPRRVVRVIRSGSDDGKEEPPGILAVHRGGAVDVEQDHRLEPRVPRVYLGVGEPEHARGVDVLGTVGARRLPRRHDDAAAPRDGRGGVLPERLDELGAVGEDVVAEVCLEHRHDVVRGIEHALDLLGVGDLHERLEEVRGHEDLDLEVPVSEDGLVVAEDLVGELGLEDLRGVHVGLGANEAELHDVVGVAHEGRARLFLGRARGGGRGRNRGRCDGWKVGHLRGPDGLGRRCAAHLGLESLELAPLGFLLLVHGRHRGGLREVWALGQPFKIFELFARGPDCAAR